MRVQFVKVTGKPKGGFEFRLSAVHNPFAVLVGRELRVRNAMDTWTCDASVIQVCYALRYASGHPNIERTSEVQDIIDRICNEARRRKAYRVRITR
jgi:hypothetical protein